MLKILIELLILIPLTCNVVGTKTTNVIKLINFPKEYYTNTASNGFKITDTFLDFDNTDVYLKFIVDTNFMTTNYGSELSQIYRELFFSNAKSDRDKYSKYKPTHYLCVYNINNNEGEQLFSTVYRTPNEIRNLQRENTRPYETLVMRCKIPKSIQILTNQDYVVNLKYYYEKHDERIDSSFKKRKKFLKMAKKGYFNIENISFTLLPSSSSLKQDQEKTPGTNNLLKIMKKNVLDNRSFLGACTMVYGHYINNWLLQFIYYYMNVIGVEKFYIYDDAGRRPTNTKKLLQKLIDAGKVIYIPWPQIPKSGKVFERQIQGMNSCIHRFGKFHKYIFIGDVDEYVVPAIDMRQIKSIESLMNPMEAWKTISYLLLSTMKRALMAVNKTVSVKNIDIGGHQLIALENKDIIWKVGDRVCTQGATSDREKSFFFTDYGGTDLTTSIIIDQGHNIVIYENNHNNTKSQQHAVYLNENLFLLYHYWSGTADNSCSFVNIDVLEKKLIVSKLDDNGNTNDKLEISELSEELLASNLSPIPTPTWIHTCQSFHKFMRHTLIDSYPTLIESI